MNKILFIFEGVREESRVFEQIKNIVPNFENKLIITCFGNNIYNLYQLLKSQDGCFENTLDILKENRNQNHTSVLSNYEPSDISEIYLFFDYDGHDPCATDEKLIEMLDFFSEETELGKLYISYPMIEAIKHFEGAHNCENASCGDICAFSYEAIENGSKYKAFINGTSCFSDLRHISNEQWTYIFSHTLKRLNCLIEKSYTISNSQRLTEISQKDIFQQQLENFINPFSRVLCIPAFPVFISQYLGEPFISQLNIV